jgi:hypothetical protein
MSNGDAHEGGRVMKDKWQTASKLLLAPLTKWLVNLSGVPIIADVAAGVVDLTARHLDNPAAPSVQQRLETLAGQILKQHAAQFDYENVAVNAEAVGQALATALGALSKHPVEKIVAANLDAARLLKLAEAENAGATLNGADRELFDAALPALIKAVVDLTPDLKGFAGASTGEILTRLDRLLKNTAPAKPDYSAWEAAYLAHMVAEHNHLELFGSELEENAKRLDLGRAYVGLRVARGRGRNAGQTTISAEALLERLGQLNAYDKAGRAVVLGAAGSGKTTLLRWAAVTAAQWEKGRPRFDKDGGWDERDWRRLIPFIIRLRDTGQMPGIDDWATGCTKTFGAPPAGWVKQVLKEGRGLVMIDGVDEIAAFDRTACARTIGQLAATYPQSAFIVTSRPAAVGDGWLAEHGFGDAEINGLAGIDQEELIEKWFTAVKPKHGAAPADMAKRLREKLRQTPRLALLGNNPLMLAMLCALFYRTPESMPDRPYSLINKLITVLMHERDQECKINKVDSRWHSLDDMQKRGLLRAVAAKMMLQPGGNSTLRFDTIDATLAKELRELGIDVGDVASFRKTVLERAGLLREAANDRVEFIHNTFKEFLAAQAFVDGADFDLLIGHAEDREWRPVLIFAASGESRNFPMKLVRYLLTAVNCTSDAWQARRFLAYACAHHALYKPDDDLQEQLDKLESSLLPPKDMEEAEMLALGEAAVAKKLASLGNKLTATNDCKRAASVRTFKLIDLVKAKEWCRIFIDEKSLTVWEELAEVINPLETPWILQELLAGALKEGVRRFISDLSPLAELSNLTELDLTGIKTSNLSPLANINNLKSLNIRETLITDISPLVRLKNLQNLDLTGTKIIDFLPLFNLYNLISLKLKETKFSNLSLLAGLSRIKILDLDGTQVDNLYPITELSNLQELNLRDTQVTDLQALAGLKSIQVLNLNGTRVHNLQPISELMDMQILILTGTPVSDLSPLAKLKNLNHLFLGKTKVTDLSPLKHLQGKCHIIR